MRMRQLTLRDGTTTTVAWVLDDAALRLGNRITLKTSSDPQRRWTIVARGASLERKQIRRGWDAGGLLPSERLV